MALGIIIFYLCINLSIELLFSYKINVKVVKKKKNALNQLQPKLWTTCAHSGKWLDATPPRSSVEISKVHTLREILSYSEAISLYLL